MAYDDCHNNPAVVAGNYAEFDRQAFGKLTAAQATLLKKIASCESGFEMKPNASGASTAFGIFQTLVIHDKRAVKLGYKNRWESAEANIAIGISLFLEQGTSPWNASKHCWK